jgi:hypothetical protein
MVDIECGKSASAQALLHDHALFDVGYFPPNTPPQA